MRPLTIGLTGGVASGKSTVAERFQALDVPVLDADQIARDLVAPGLPCYQAIVRYFGVQCVLPDQTLNRPWLRNALLHDAAAKAVLERILHPAIHQTLAAQILQMHSPYVVIVIPLLVESQWHRELDRVCVVDLPEKAQLERLIARDGMSEQDAQQLIRLQASRAERLAIAHDCIDNMADFAALSQQVKRLHAQYLQLAHDRI